MLLQLEDDDSNSVPLVKFPNVNGKSILLKSGKANQIGSPELKHSLHSQVRICRIHYGSCPKRL